MLPFLVIMTSSPFHGIFGALSTGASKSKSGWERTEDSASTAAPADSSIGRVAVDIYEQENFYVVKAPIAGVRMADLDIEVNDNVLTIRGHRKQTDSIPTDQYYMQECFFGPFERRVTLPCPIDPRKVKATFNKECILKVFIPKEEKVKVVRILEA